MKKVAMLFSAFLVFTSCYAAVNTHAKDAGKLGALGALFSTNESNIAKNHEDRVKMVYGGEDVSRQPTLAMHTLS